MDLHMGIYPACVDPYLATHQGYLAPYLAIHRARVEFLPNPLLHVVSRLFHCHYSWGT